MRTTTNLPSAYLISLQLIIGNLVAQKLIKMNVENIVKDAETGIYQESKQLIQLEKPLQMQVIERIVKGKVS